jgi:hypothetical protein
MAYLAKWFLKTGAAMLVIGFGFLALQRKGLSGNIPGNMKIALGKHSLRLPLGTSAVLLVVATLYANIFGRSQ